MLVQYYSYRMYCLINRVHNLISFPLSISFQIWHFRDSALTFKGFDDPVQKDAFKRRMDRLKPVTQPMRENITDSKGNIVIV